MFDYRLIKLRCCGRGLLYKVGSNDHLSNRNVSKDAFHSFVRKGVFSSNQFKVGHFGLHKVRTTAWPIDVSRGYEESIPQYAIHSDSAQTLFGMKGRRWCLKPITKGLYNERSVRSCFEEGSPDASKVERADIGGVRFRKCAAHHG